MKYFYAIPLLLTLSACGSLRVVEDMHEKPLSEVSALAANENLAAMHDLCYRFIYGRHAPLDYAEAFKWCSLAASKGVDSSQVLLGEMYYKGKGAANRGYLHAVNELAKQQAAKEK